MSDGPLYLVTGAAGFIGCNLVRALLARGQRVRGVDNFATGHAGNLQGLRFDFRKGDINDAAFMQDAMRDVSYVLHHAALPSVARSLQQPLECHHANATGTLAVLEAARQAGCIKRVVYAASSSAYGNTQALPKVETMPAMPRSPYAVAKLAGEVYGQMYTELYGLPCVALRYFNVFGPHQDPQSRYAAVVPKFVQCILRDTPPPIEGNGQQSRDFTYIDNVVEANIKACTAPRAPGLVINIACGKRVTLIELVDLINQAAGKKIAPLFGAARPGDVQDSLADITRARTYLDYIGGVDLKEGLQRALDWYRANLN